MLRPRGVLLPLLIVLLTLAVGCKPTERNYRSAYDVAIMKKDRENRELEEMRRESGMEHAVMEEVDGARLITYGDRQYYTRHLHFPKADSIATYAVSVASFRMDTNAKAMASDLQNHGWKAARHAKSGDNWYVIVADSPEDAPAVEAAARFGEANPGWNYVGQPGLLMLVGGSR